MEDLEQQQTQVLPVRKAGGSRFFGKRVHFIGIGGCGMSGLAKILADAGAVVTGSEPKPGKTTMALAKCGVKISRDQVGELLNRDIDLVVRTAAVKDDNPEYKYARTLELPVVKYAQLLGDVMRERLGVAVSGTHGKSTTTGMIAYTMTLCQQDPSWVVGGTVPQLKGGSGSGTGKAFVVEACEYDRSFHNLFPTVALITNIDADHLDCYKDINDIIESFRTFISRIPNHGLIICDGADENVRKAVAGAPCRVETVAVGQPATWSVVPTGIVNGCQTGQILREGKVVASLQLSVPGEHNLFNATMAVAACAACGVQPDMAAATVSTFTGVDRRMSHVGSYRGAIVVDDYGHHPREIRATLRALREQYQPRRLFCCFQPHQYSRTRLLFSEFAACFADADQAILADIYRCRDSEEDVKAVNTPMLVEAVRKNGRDAVHVPDFTGMVKYLKTRVGEGDLVLTIGAGNIWEVGKELVDLGTP